MICTFQQRNGSKELMRGSVNVVNMNLCSNLTNRICAGQDNIHGCPGDDGGPFICNDKVFGLIDFKPTDHCEKDNLDKYENYINVADYYKWIMEVIETTSTNTTTPTPSTNVTTTIPIGNITTTMPIGNVTTTMPTTNVTTTMPTTNATTTMPSNATTPITTTTRKSTGNDAVNTIASVLLLTLTVILSVFVN